MYEIPCEWSFLNGDIIVGLPGRFNIYNGMCAACTGALLKNAGRGDSARA